MSPRALLLALAGLGLVAFAGLWVLKAALDPLMVDTCLDRGGRWNAGDQRCEFSASIGPPAVVCDSIAGEVRRGQGFEAPFGDGLRFRLDPSGSEPGEPQGWTIQVLRGDLETAWVATPPYRAASPRDLTTAYGASAAEVVAFADRRFAYATGEAEYAALAGLVDTLLRPPEDLPPAGRDSVHARWQARLDRAGRGELRIVESEVAGPTRARPGGTIERIAFEAALCPPADGDAP